MAKKEDVATCKGCGLPLDPDKGRPPVDADGLKFHGFGCVKKYHDNLPAEKPKEQAS